MKLQYGKRYVTASGRITGPLKVNPNQSIAYPFLDECTGRPYSQSGLPSSGNEIDDIVGLYYEEPATELPQVVDTVTISRKDYDRFVALERAFKEVYEQTKELQ